MDLSKLFEAQKKLDERIVEEKGLQGQDLLDEKILALQVELGELANEWEMFKFWKKNPKPNTGKKIAIECGWCEGQGRDVVSSNDECEECDGTGRSGEYATMSNKVLEEYIDVLHFTLSIGNDLDQQPTICEYKEYIEFTEPEVGITRQFITTNYLVSMLIESPKSNYNLVMFENMRLGEMLGFTWDQIETAYYAKNKINHARQENGY